MSTKGLAYEHLDCSGKTAVIAGKNFKVIHLIGEHIAYGWTAEEIALNHPQLTLGEVYSALAYYADNRDRIDQELASDERSAKTMHAEPRHRRIASRLKRSA